MCGRFSLNSKDLSQFYNLSNEDYAEVNYNITPMSRVPIIVAKDGQNCLEMAVWGFTLQFGDKKTLIINAKSETLEQKKTFAKLTDGQRCILPASGFYEWDKVSEEKIPYHIFVKNQEVLSMGGLYRIERINGVEVMTCVIITTAANKLVQKIHNRMPLILSKKDEKVWLNGTQKEALKIMKPFDAKLMDMHTVSKKINKGSAYGKELIEPFSYDLAK